MSILDPVENVTHSFVEVGGNLTGEVFRGPQGRPDFRLAVAGTWSLPITGIPQKEEIHGFQCELYSGTSTAGDRLEVWVTHDYGLNLREVITGPDGVQKQEWRLIEVERKEPDAAVFSAPKQ